MEQAAGYKDTLCGVHCNDQSAEQVDTRAENDERRLHTKAGEVTLNVAKEAARVSAFLPRPLRFPDRLKR